MRSGPRPKWNQAPGPNEIKAGAQLWLGARPKWDWASYQIMIRLQAQMRFGQSWTRFFRVGSPHMYVLFPKWKWREILGTIFDISPTRKERTVFWYLWTSDCRVPKNPGRKLTLIFLQRIVGWFWTYQLMLLLSVCLYEFQNLILCIELCQAMSIYADIILVNARRYLSNGVNFWWCLDIGRY